MLIHTANHETTYESLLSQLQGAIQTEEEAKLAVQSRKIQAPHQTYVLSGQPMYTSQLPKFSSNPRTTTRYHQSSSGYRYTGNQNSTQNRNSVTCWNCNKPHKLAACPYKKNVKRIAENRMEFYAKRFPNRTGEIAAQVLYELVDQLEEDSSSPEISDANQEHGATSSAEPEHRATIKTPEEFAPSSSTQDSKGLDNPYLKDSDVPRLEYHSNYTSTGDYQGPSLTNVMADFWGGVE